MAVTPASATATWSPSAASRRTIARAMGPSAGERQTVPTLPTSFSPRIKGSPVSAGALSRSPRSVLRRDRRGAHVEAEARAPRLDPDPLGLRLADLGGAGPLEPLDQSGGSFGARDQVDSDIGRDREDLRAVPLTEALGMFGTEALEAGELIGPRPDQRGDRPTLADVLDLDVAADAVGA